MPPLTQNIEGLRRHALLIGIFRWRSLRSTVRSMQLTSISPVHFRNTIQHRFRRYRWRWA